MTNSYPWSGTLESLRNNFKFRVFGIPLDEPGLLDFCREEECTVLSDERTASLAALGYALAAPNLLPVLCLESGPSFMNALMGLSESESACVPQLVLVHAVENTRRPFGAFQELQIEELATSLKLDTIIVTSLSESERAIMSAAESAVATSRPVVVILRVGLGSELESCVGNKKTWTMNNSNLVEYRTEVKTPEASIHMLDKMRFNGRKITVIVGGGVRRTSLKSVELKSFVSSLDADLLVTASGRGSVDEKDTSFLGLAGIYATPEGNRACAEADILVLLGTSVEETVRERWAPKRGATMMVVNIVPPPIPVHDGVRIDVTTDVQHFVRTALSSMFQKSIIDYAEFKKPDKPLDRESLTVWNTVSDLLDDGHFSALCIENGLHDIWAYDTRYFTIGRPMPVITCAEQSAMGVAVCGALGFKDLSPTLVICGDSTLRMHLPAVTDAVELNLPVTYIVLNSGGMGWPGLSRADDRITKYSWNQRLAEVLEAIGVAVFQADEVEVRRLRESTGPTAVMFDLSLQRPPWEDFS